MSPQSLDPHNAKAYRRRGRLSSRLGLGAIPIAAAALIDPTRLKGGAIAQTLGGPLDTIWLIMYLAGGILAAAGVLWRPIPRPELEVAGVWLLIGAMLINGLAIVAVRGPVAGLLTALGLFVIADVLYARARDLDEARDRRRPGNGVGYNGPGRRAGDREANRPTGPTTDQEIEHRRDVLDDTA
jgi:hypothetical protein